MRRKTNLACVQLFRFLSMLYMLYKLMSAYLSLLVILFHKLRLFSNFAIVFNTLVAMDTGYRNILTFLFFSFKTRSIVYFLMLTPSITPML